MNLPAWLANETAVLIIAVCLVMLIVPAVAIAVLKKKVAQQPKMMSDGELKAKLEKINLDLDSPESK
ncbi:hypothetical protein GCM10011450_03770 [Advenella faeciporci]|uniref:Uncharacterized protein n=1 Tax=Advenella faeciporci TaxID=797535 RepID=A0A918JG41_9BURK|nr:MULTISPECIES: hypothetical protein [Advenella]NLY34688.1 hypothetical protein [Alcaligenaceae bacterium]WKU18258.1 hypothetical protein Q3V95_07960 [Advenella alkanexedens]GGW77329.1 hypothetical protein GCM10011450_03770 [Advenella faeciporci]